MKKIYIAGIVSLLTIVLVPNLALAAWWNPFSWFSNKVMERPSVVNQVPTSTVANSGLLRGPKSKVTTSSENRAPTNNPKGTAWKDNVVISGTIPGPIFSAKIAGDIGFDNPVLTNESAISLGKSLLTTFVANPTPESLRTLCNNANGVKFSSSRTVLSPDRMSMVSASSTLFEVMHCEIINSSDYVIVTVVPGLLQRDFDNADSDEVRIAKINYNAQIKKFLEDGGVVVIKNDPTNTTDQSSKHLVTAKEAKQILVSVYDPVKIAKALIGAPGSVWGAMSNKWSMGRNEGQFLYYGL